MPRRPVGPALPKFAPGSPYRRLLTDLASPDAERRRRADDRIRDLDPFDSFEQARTASWFVSESDAHAILAAACDGDYPAPEHHWEDGLGRLISLLWRSPHRSLAPAVVGVYAKATTDERRSALLALLGAIATREAAVAFMACVRDHGWPEGAYMRVYDEMAKLLAHPDVMLPDVVLKAGRRTTHVLDAVIRAAADGTLKLDRAGPALEALAPFVTRSLKKALTAARKRQKKGARAGIGWRFAEGYWRVRHAAAALLDMSGYLRDRALSPLLRQALRMADPRLVTFAALSLLRRGESVPASALDRSAACHETRTILFEGLRALRMERAFPKRWRTWEAFAAAGMVEWLMFPSELGREPDDLELRLREWVDRGKKVAAYVWRFRVKGEAWMAGVSGPYTLRGQPGPGHGPLTFSRFDKWDDATAEQHLERCAGTVAEWAAARGRSARR